MASGHCILTSPAVGAALTREWAKIWMRDEEAIVAIQTKQYLNSLNQSNLSTATSTELECSIVDSINRNNSQPNDL